MALRRSREKAGEERARMLETRSHAWAAAGLSIEIDRPKVRRARRRLAMTVPLLIASVVGEIVAIHRIQHPHHHPWIVTKTTPVQVLEVLVVVVLGWVISGDLSRIAPPLFRRMDPAAAGTVGFLIRLASVLATAMAALAVGGISASTIALGGAFTAVVVGLAAQQTLGNLFAGMVLLSARPFRVGERVRLQAGAVGGTVEGVVSSLGLLYTTLTRGDDRILIPNNVVLLAVVVPLHEFDSVDVKVRLTAGVTSSQLQAILDTQIVTETRTPPSVVLEEIESDAVVVRVRATPERHSDGVKLADEIIDALQGLTGEHPVVSADERSGD
jgi:small-conductance mechanosensitive channel